MGKNTIGNIMKTMKENSPLPDGCPDKKLTNLSARRNGCKEGEELRHSEMWDINIIGHSSERLHVYDSGDEKEQRIMFNIIDNAADARQVL